MRACSLARQWHHTLGLLQDRSRGTLLTNKREICTKQMMEKIGKLQLPTLKLMFLLRFVSLVASSLLSHIQGDYATTVLDRLKSVITCNLLASMAGVTTGNN